MSLFAKTQVGLAAVVAVAILGGTTAAHAQTFTFSGATPGSQVVSVSDDSGKTYEQAYAGQYHATLGNAPINIFCVDIGHAIHDNDIYAANTQYRITDAAGPLSGGYYQGGLASAITTNDLGSVTVTAAQATGRAGEVAWLADNYLGAMSFSGVTDLNPTDNLTAINLSIWDIVRDGGDGLSTGQVQASSLGDLSGLVTHYESLASVQTGYQSNTATWIQAPQTAQGDHMQDYVYVKPTNGGGMQAVPEPGVPTMLACLGVVAGGLVLRRKRMARAASRA